MFSEGMTLFFLDHHNTTLPYPRVLRLDGEAAPNGIQLRPGSAGSANQQALERHSTTLCSTLHPARTLRHRRRRSSYAPRTIRTPPAPRLRQTATFRTNLKLRARRRQPPAHSARPRRGRNLPHQPRPHQPRQGGTSSPRRRAAAPYSPAGSLPQAGTRQLLRR